jgi:L-alanine-DL-glutamate epimerase-like enolase superfamily enzyme
MNRRNFLQCSTVGAAALLAGVRSPVRAASAASTSKTLQLSFRPYTLSLKHAFTLSSTSRTTTPAVLTQIAYDGQIGYGEASMPPYLGESQESVQKFLSRLDLSPFKDPLQLEEILAYVDGVEEKNTAAKASVDIALHDLVGKLLGQPLHTLWGYDGARAPRTSYTIGIDTPEVVEQKAREVSGFKIFKIKMGRGTDREIVQAVRRVTDVPFTADPNQGWTDRQEALDTIFWLQEQGCLFVEQPLPKERVDDTAWLTERSPIPVLADEGVQRLVNIKDAQGVYSGIVVKLMKCTGLREAQKMLITARALGMKTLLGCMTETSCAISAASQLSMIADFADLDGNLLIANDLFDGTSVQNGMLKLRDIPGIGITPKSES